MASKTKQKSCIACAAAKRRCNLQLPKCSRCESRRFPCEYKSNPRDTGKQNPSPVQDSSEMIMDSAPLDLSFSAPQDPLAMYSITDIPMSLPATETMQLEEEDTISPAFFTAYDAALITTPQIGLMDRPRIVHIVRQLRTYPTQLYLTGKTPFIHPNAYKPLVPPPLQDAICISALYANKNTQNEEMVWDIITSKASLLLAHQSPTSWSISSHLSSLQALIILQIIRLFDGEICQRSLAEDVQPTLEEWTDRLAARTGVSPISSAESMVQNSWESWLFHEMLCRTIIISRMVQAMFAIQKQGYCTLVEAVTEMSFTARKGLWDASSSAHWERVLRDKDSLKVIRMNFGELEKIRLGDVDELTLLMLVTYKGVDGVNEWILKMGGDELIE